MRQSPVTVTTSPTILRGWLLPGLAAQGPGEQAVLATARAGVLMDCHRSGHRCPIVCVLPVKSVAVCYHGPLERRMRV
ncbi:hypothetical protein EXIGLDRAFT_363632 [Exidia glandulosa HHB12029]|uniref:Uncharacterized protein n=1 Tax=Exidia glandulosa HHB12029 TaxID=1314781 RepID=A0A165C4U8_EXIGL|nr:hypothetical protein EXIGLDRAFT_363632 [Exidia glandulosa HHB12029]